MPDQPLDDALRSFLNNWRDDLTPAWQKVLASVSPAFEDVREDLLLREGEMIYPGRKATPLPGASKGAHVFRALARVAPGDVKAVVIGQDPYPEISRATGRAFEQGDLRSWTEPVEVAPSLKRLLQITAYHRTGDESFLAETAGWEKVAGQLASGDLAIDPPQPLFDYWEDQGVIFLNAGLTISRFVKGGGPEQAYGHIPLWRPVVQQIFRALVARQEGRVVFLTWGAFARRVLKDSGVDHLPGWGSRADAAAYAHPVMPGFLRPPNPFAKANEVLAGLGAAPIAW